MKASQVGTGWPEALAAATQQLSGQEQANLLAILVKMIRALQLQGEIPVARMCVSCEHFSPDAHPNSAAFHHCQFFDAPLADQSLRLDCSIALRLLPGEAGLGKVYPSKIRVVVGSRETVLP
jgi:hypothetical protein